MSNGKAGEQLLIKDSKNLNQIFDILRTASGVDFTYYKQNTIKRRIQRRLSLHKLTSVEEYVTYIQRNKHEVNELYYDLLINVTSFFRDPQVFIYIKNRIFPHLLKNKSMENPIRIWVPGCATGEEVYSLAISLIEYLEDPARRVSASIQIFGTDISDEAIEKARTGIYEKGIEKDMSHDQLERFFTKYDDKHYQINKTVREICVFAKQNIVSDPPFSNLDLISCRNLLIYLEPIMQKRIIPLFHYALKPQGYLLLGNSETIGEFIDLFEIQDKRNKIYSKKTTFTTNHLQFYGANHPRVTITKQKKPSLAEEELNHLSNIQQEVDKIIINRYAPAGVVVNNNLDIIQFKGKTSSYLEPSPGKASLKLLKMSKEGMFLVLNSAIKQARKEGKIVRKDHVQFVQNGKSQFVSIEVIPIKNSVDTEANFLILFEEPKSQKGNGEKTVSQIPQTVITESDQLLYLNQELTATREYLQSAISELESTNEDLQVANEEILSNNEELQSVNEELETSKEELQSANEELITLNEELQIRNDQIRQINNDLSNLLESVNIPIVMLDKDLYIRRFTPGVEKVMNLINSDIGRPIGNIRPNIVVSDLEEYLFDAIHRDMVKETELQDKQGRWYLMRVLPYKAANNKTEGVILAFIDIDTLKKNEIELARAAAIVDSSDDAIISQSNDGEILTWNKGAEELYGYTSDEVIGKKIAILMPPNKKNDFPTIMKQLSEGNKIEHYETQRMTKDKRILDISLTISPLKDANGKIIGASKIARDITERKRTEENLKFLANASRLLSSSLDVQTTLGNVIKLAVPHIADWCTIEILNEQGELEQIAVAHKDPKKIAWAKELRRQRPVNMNDKTGSPNVIRTGKSEFYPVITDDMLVAASRSEKDLKLIRDLGFSSAITVPISINGKAVGTMSFITTESHVRYTESDLAMVEDLANRVSMAIQNATLYKQAQDAVVLRDEFISVASHELRTPLTSIKVYSHYLQKKLDESIVADIAQEPLTKMNNQLNRLELLINDLLSVSRLQHGKITFDLKPFDLDKVIEETVEMFQQTTGHTIVIDGVCGKPVQGDGYRIAQVLVNLLNNAIKYSPASSKVIVKITKRNDMVTVSVQDFGIGIEKSHHAKLFDQFYRVTSLEERTYPGLGMGLYIANEIIKRHGGTMSIVSEKGKGSTFSFTIPYKR